MSAVDEKKKAEAAPTAPAPAEKPSASSKGFKVMAGPIEYSGHGGRAKAQTGDIVQLNDDDAKLMVSLGAVEPA